VDIMLKTILLPLDGSPLAERALPYAATLAQRANATIALVEAVVAHVFPGSDLSNAQIDVTKRADHNLQAAADRLGAAGVTAEPHVYYDEAVHAILDAADRQAADLIVMSTHGRSELGRMLYGSVADQVLRRATVPVLLVPPGVSHAWSTERPLSVLVPLDGSELAEEALESADLLAEHGDTRLTLLRVIEPPSYPVYGDGYAYIPYDEDAAIADARKYLQAQQARLHERGREAEVKVAVGVAGGVIPAVAREQAADVIVMATHGHGGLTRLIIGSVATSTLRQTTVPLLLVRPAALHRAALVHAEATAAAALVGTALGALDGPAQAGPTVDVRLSQSDLELIERGLLALAQIPGTTNGQGPAAHALATRLATQSRASLGEPITAR
jgi:nucleotide-binding universal stress UspA family protein